MRAMTEAHKPCSETSKSWRSRLLALVLLRRRFIKVQKRVQPVQQSLRQPLSITPNESQYELVNGAEEKPLSFLDLPNEILLLIAESLESPLHISRLLQTSRRLTSLLTPLLHQHGVRDKDGIPALHWAARRGHVGLVRTLLQKGINVDLTDPQHRGWTALHLAAEEHESVVRVLLEYGANVSFRDRFDETPLYRATSRPDNLGIVKMLLEAGANIHDQNFHGDGLLHRAVRHQVVYPAMVKLLLDLGVDVSLKNGFGETAVHVAGKSSDFTEALILLLEKGDALDCVDSNGKTVLHYVVVCRSRHLLSSMRPGDFKLNVNIQDRDGRTPLHLAMINGNMEWVEFLMKRGADSLIKDYQGQTVLDYQKTWIRDQLMDDKILQG
ncbi:ankyrin repeat-containing domain protein [Morchella snyderi]|nr:ankyrin repeat-containing domain protein [Morchella snyderi]